MKREKEAALGPERPLENMAGASWEPFPFLSLPDSFALRIASTSHHRWAVMLDDDVEMKSDFDFEEDAEHEMWRRKAEEEADDYFEREFYDSQRSR